jgi:tetratricopeptide (TPR) repeat protein
MREALRGLSFDRGVVTLTAESGQIGRRGTLDEGARLAAEAERIFQTNDFPAAVAAYAKSVIVAPSRSESYLGLGNALAPAGYVTEAEAAFRTALGLDPKSLAAKTAIARLVDSRGDAAATIAAWKSVLAQDPKSAEAHGRIAIATYYQGDVAGAWRHIAACERLGGSVPAQFKDLVRSEVSSARP